MSKTKSASPHEQNDHFPTEIECAIYNEFPSRMVADSYNSLLSRLGYPHRVCEEHAEGAWQCVRQPSFSIDIFCAADDRQKPFDQFSTALWRTPGFLLFSLSPLEARRNDTEKLIQYRLFPYEGMDCEPLQHFTDLIARECRRNYFCALCCPTLLHMALRYQRGEKTNDWPLLSLYIPIKHWQVKSDQEKGKIIQLLAKNARQMGIDLAATIQQCCLILDNNGINDEAPLLNPQLLQDKTLVILRHGDSRGADYWFHRVQRRPPTPIVALTVNNDLTGRNGKKTHHRSPTQVPQQQQPIILLNRNITNTNTKETTYVKKIEEEEEEVEEEDEAEEHHNQ